MKKNFKLYVLCWAILLALFNLICFLTPNEAAGLSKFGGAFWVGYAFITLAFAGQLLCAHTAFQSKNAKKLFYRLPLVTLSYTGLIFMLIFGSAAMAIPNLPGWAGAVACLLVLGLNAIAVLKARAAANAVERVEEAVAANTRFVQTATVTAKGIVDRAKSEAARAESKKVYEALRYADPVSHCSLALEEAKITAKLNELNAAVTADDFEKTAAAAREVLLLVADRNSKCKLLK